MFIDRCPTHTTVATKFLLQFYCKVIIMKIALWICTQMFIWIINNLQIRRCPPHPYILFLCIYFPQCAHPVHVLVDGLILAFWEECYTMAFPPILARLCIFLWTVELYTCSQVSTRSCFTGTIPFIWDLKHCWNLSLPRLLLDLTSVS